MISIILFLIGLICVHFIPPSATAFYLSGFGLFATLFRLGAHMVTHGSLGHLLGNFMFGAPYLLYAEYQLGWKRFLKLFFYSGLAAVFGMFLACLLNPNLAGGMIGSSGAIFGVCAYVLASLKGDKWIRGAALALLAFHFLTQLNSSYEMIAYGFGFVAYPAHLGGIVYGATCAWVPALLGRPQCSSK